jgi:hypothetical protein
VSPGNVGVLYLADSPKAAIVEVVRGRLYLTPDEVETRALARVSLANLRLADVSGLDGITFGLTPEIAVSGDEGPSQRWGAALVAAAFDGVVYPSRHAAGRLIALFGAAGSTGPPERLAEAHPITREALQAIGVRVLPVPSDGELDFVDWK